MQDKVRYVALAMGAGGLVPADAQTTWSRRFGDCKAKTALLLGLLHELGIEAEPLLVHSVLGDALPQRLPMVAAFDHVLVRARIGGQEYFLDGTNTDETSLARLDVPHFSWGLPVVESGAELVAMVPAPLAEPAEDIVLRIDATGGVRAPAPVRAEALFRGDQAIFYNAALAQFYGPGLEQALKEYWRGQESDFSPEDVAMAFDRETGEFRLTATGTMEMDWDYSRYEPRGMRVGFQADFSRAPGSDADAPFAIGHPFFRRKTEMITLPEGFTQAQVDGEAVEQIIAGREYRRELTLADNVFTATRSVLSLAPEFAAEEADTAKAMLERLWDKRVFLRLPPGYRLSEADVAAMSQARGEDASELVRQGNALLDAGQYKAAIAVFDKVVDIAPGDQWGWANRALAKAHLQDHAGAAADSDRALAINADNWVAYNATGVSAGWQGDMVRATEAFTAAIARNPENTFAYRQRANLYLLQDELEPALADARRVIEANPDFPLNYVLEISILARGDDREALAAATERLRTRYPDQPELLAGISTIYLENGLEDLATELLVEANQNGPSAASLLASARSRQIDETEQKLAELDQALELQPDFYLARLLRAETLWLEYELEKALSDAEQAIAIAPAYPEAYRVKYKILLDMERQREAEQLVDGLLEQFPGNGLVLAEAAHFYRELDRDRKAIAAAESAYALAPEQEFVRMTYDLVTGKAR